MSNSSQLILFDVDGTLVDSQVSIIAAMYSAFDKIGRLFTSRSKFHTLSAFCCLELFRFLSQMRGSLLMKKPVIFKK